MTGDGATKDNVGTTRKISELSDLDLSRLIAEEMEPFANLPSVTSYLFGPPIYSFPVIPPTYWRDDFDSKSWQPRNFVTDSAMRDLLQEKLLEEEYHFTYWPQADGSIIAHFSDGVSDLIKIHAKRERIAAEAYALAHGLGEK